MKNRLNLSSQPDTSTQSPFLPSSPSAASSQQSPQQQPIDSKTKAKTFSSSASASAVPAPSSIAPAAPTKASTASRSDTSNTSVSVDQAQAPVQTPSVPAPVITSPPAFLSSHRSQGPTRLAPSVPTSPPSSSSSSHTFTSSTNTMNRPQQPASSPSHPSQSQTQTTSAVPQPPTGAPSRSSPSSPPVQPQVPTSSPPPPGSAPSSRSSSRRTSSAAPVPPSAPPAPSSHAPTAPPAPAAPTTNGETTEGEAAVEDHIINRNLPRCRRSRMVDHSVIMGPPIPALRDAPLGQRSSLLIKKVRLCSYVFPPSEKESATVRSKKDLKRQVLLELYSYMTTFKPSLTDEQVSEIFEMIRLNLFRPTAKGESGGVEEEPKQERLWQHLQVIYEFLLVLASSTETDLRVLEKHFSQSFVLGLLELFDSEDPRERDYLKTVLHRIYGNFMALRPFIRRSINNVFFRLIYETGRHNGVSELLEILGSIINGFALPLKEQHKQFLSRVLLPLHKVEQVGEFHSQLSYCVTQFLEKDISLGPRVLSSILRYWPQTTSKKEVLFLSEVDEILIALFRKPEILADVVVPLFRRLSMCIGSPHFQVSERALAILNTDYCMKFVEAFHQKVTPILAVALYSNTHMVAVEVERLLYENTSWIPGASTRPHGHWNSTIVDTTSETLKLFTDIDTPFMVLCKQEFDSKIVENLVRARNQRRLWDAVEDRVLENSPATVRDLILLEKVEAAKCVDNLQKKMNYNVPEPL